MRARKSRSQDLPSGVRWQGEGNAAGAGAVRDSRMLPFPEPIETGRAVAFQAPVYHPGQWLSLPEAALYIGLPESTLRKLLMSGRLRALDTGPRFGGRWRVKRSDLDAI